MKIWKLQDICLQVEFMIHGLGLQNVDPTHGNQNGETTTEYIP